MKLEVGQAYSVKNETPFEILAIVKGYVVYQKSHAYPVSVRLEDAEEYIKGYWTLRVPKEIFYVFGYTSRYNGTTYLHAEKRQNTAENDRKNYLRIGHACSDIKEVEFDKPVNVSVPVNDE